MCEVESPKVEKIWKETASHMELTCKMGLKNFFKIEGPSPTIIYPTKISIPYFSYNFAFLMQLASLDLEFAKQYKVNDPNKGTWNSSSER